MTDVAPPAGCRATFETVGGVLFCRLTLDGIEAARGRAVVVDGLTIFDRIRWSPIFDDAVWAAR